MIKGFTTLAMRNKFNEGIFYFLKSTNTSNTGVVLFPKLQDSLVSLFRKTRKNTATPFSICLTFKF